MEECAERAFTRALPPCAVLTTLVATLHAAPQIKYLTSPGDQGGLFPELSYQLKKLYWAVLLALA